MTKAGVGASRSPTNAISLRGVMAPYTQPSFKVNKIMKSNVKEGCLCLAIVSQVLLSKSRRYRLMNSGRTSNNSETNTSHKLE